MFHKYLVLNDSIRIVININIFGEVYIKKFENMQVNQ